MTEENDDGFSRDYVQELRNEAAKYRTQVRDLESRLEKVDQLESQVNQARVENELIRRGVKADPSWVPISDDQDPSEAVEDFLEKWPHLGESTNTQEEEEETNNEPKQKSEKPLPRNKNTNTDSPGPKAKGAWTDRSLDEIQQDPQAKENLSDLYKELVKGSSHQQ